MGTEVRGIDLMDGSMNKTQWHVYPPVTATMLAREEKDKIQ